MLQEHSLVYVYSGEMLLEEAGQGETRVHNGECAFIRRNHRISMVKQPKGDEQYQGIFMMFKRNFLRDLYRKLDKNTIPPNVQKHDFSVIKLPPTPDITGLFQSLIPYFDVSVKPSEEMMNLKLMEGVYSLLNIGEQFYPCLFDFTAPWKIDIMEFMDNNYMYELTVEDMACFTGRSLAAFKRDFKTLSDLPPEKWLIEKRLNVAFDKIRNERQKASEVCFEVGFKSLAHFSTSFKKQFGYPPTAK
jgi:AraC-like DNA-binding protein